MTGPRLTPDDLLVMADAMRAYRDALLEQGRGKRPYLRRIYDFDVSRLDGLIDKLERAFVASKLSEGKP